MSGQDVIQYLRDLARDLDAGRHPRTSLLRRVIVPVAVPAAMGLVVGCGPMHTPYGTDPPEVDEVCDNDFDDDDDGFVDCEDTDCAAAPECVPEVIGVYGVPFEDCCDSLDNDYDGNVDCADEDCFDQPVCSIAAYAVPFESDCFDGRDNDCDTLIDCDDDECFSDCEPVSVALYAEPFEMEAICDDGVDNDGDELIDCDDPDCEGGDDCPLNELMYGAPFPEFSEICDDGVDNDGDELVDCDDPDCLQDEACLDVDS